MERQDYRTIIIDALNQLNIAQTRMYTAMINVGMAGTLSDINSFEVGDVIPFEIESFEDSGDASLESIVSLIKEMEVVKRKIMNLNAVNEEELDEVPGEE